MIYLSIFFNVILLIPYIIAFFVYRKMQKKKKQKEVKTSDDLEIDFSKEIEFLMNFEEQKK